MALTVMAIPPWQETFPRNKTIPPLFEPLTIRGVVFPNRIFVVSIQSDSDRQFGHESGGAYRGGASRRCASTVRIMVTRRTGTMCILACVSFLKGCTAI